LIRLASEYTAAHLSARFLAAISGLLLVRILPVNEYGFYTLVLAAFTFICTFSDLGATETLSFFRWRAGKKSKSWVPYFHAVMRFRRMVFMFAFISSAAYVLSMGLHLGIEISTTLIAISLIGLSAWLAIHSGIIAYVLKLEQRFRQAYVVELSNDGVKLLAAGMIWALGLATAIAGMVGVAVGALVSVIIASRLSGHSAAIISILNRRQHNRRNRMLLGQLLPILPGTIHFALQAPLIAWFAAYYGTVANLAEVGALGRLGALIGVLTGFTSTVYVPRLLVIKDDRLFIRRYLYWWFVLLMLSGVMLLAVWVFPDALLYLLGDAYSGLHIELLVVAATAVAWMWNGYVYSVNRARGWVKRQEYVLFVLIVGQIGMFIYLEFSNTLDVLLFGMGTALLWVIFQLALNVSGFVRILKT